MVKFKKIWFIKKIQFNSPASVLLTGTIAGSGNNWSHWSYIRSNRWNHCERSLRLLRNLGWRQSDTDSWVFSSAWTVLISLSSSSWIFSLGIVRRSRGIFFWRWLRGNFSFFISWSSIRTGRDIWLRSWGHWWRRSWHRGYNYCFRRLNWCAWRWWDWSGWRYNNRISRLNFWGWSGTWWGRGRFRGWYNWNRLRHNFRSGRRRGRWWYWFYFLCCYRQCCAQGWWHNKLLNQTAPKTCFLSL